MHKKYKIFISFVILIGISLGSFRLFADESKLTGYDLYEFRNKELCSVYKPEKPIYSAENDYEDLGSFEDSDGNKTGDKYGVDGNDLEVAKSQYKETMNSIYKCALLNAQERSIKFILETLKEKNEVTAYTKQLEAKKTRLKNFRKTYDCLDTNKTNKANDQKNVIDQATYEICKYNNYLEYLYEYNSVIANVLEQDKKSVANGGNPDDQISATYNMTMIANMEKQKKAAIKDEIERAYKIFPIAFQAYTEYENNLPVHDLLVMLRNDFIEFRLDLHKNLNPINQVVYKISNAMKE